VQRSSETIGTIAAALAKAQGQLVNPEKSLVATIRSEEVSGSKRSFRYAPLSSGLDIVRKTLSQHEIATQYKPPQSTRQSASSASTRFWRMRPVNGLPPIGQSARQRDSDPVSDGSGPDLCPALCSIGGLVSEQNLDALASQWARQSR